MGGRASEGYLNYKKVDPVTASKVLTSLNSLGTADEIANIINTHAGDTVLSMQVARRILARKLAMGEFKHLSQLISVPRIGPKRFADIVEALSK